jgi:hypothetical protein
LRSSALDPVDRSIDWEHRSRRARDLISISVLCRRLRTPLCSSSPHVPPHARRHALLILTITRTNHIRPPQQSQAPLHTPAPNHAPQALRPHHVGRGRHGPNHACVCLSCMRATVGPID